MAGSSIISSNHAKGSFISMSDQLPLSVSGWRHLLRGYPNQDIVHFFLSGISEGFRIGYNYKEFTCKSAQTNLFGALSHPEIVDQYLETKISLGRVIGPFPPKGVPDVHLKQIWGNSKESPT